MNNLNNSVDEVVECPLCMEPLEVDDLNFFPCTCGYQICRFCWHRIRTDENELCPACRKEYPENPADFKPLTQEEMIAFKSQKRQRDQQRKQKITENRKHLANVRVVQKNLVFVVGLSPRLADADILKKHEYFGKYGKIHKVVINPSTAYAGIQGPSASAYVTYVHNADALRAIQSVNNIMIDGRLIKTSLGTTKYCSHFMKNQQCPKSDCMYLHELGDPEASFTKEEMHQGKHQEYEKRLHDVLIASSTGCVVSTSSTSTGNSKNSEGSKITGVNLNCVPAAISPASTCLATNNLSSTAIDCIPQKEIWPSLSISPVNQKEISLNNSNKSKKERARLDKNKIDKNIKTKTNRINTTLNPLPKEIDLSVLIEIPSTNNNCLTEQQSKVDKNKERIQHGLINRPNPKMSTIAENHSVPSTSTSPNLERNNSGYVSNNDTHISKVDNQRSLGLNNNSSSSCIITTSENNSFINESISGKSSPGCVNQHNANDVHVKSSTKYKLTLTPSLEVDTQTESNNNKTNLSEKFSKCYGYVDNFFEKNENSGLNIPKDNTSNMTKNVYLKEESDNNRYQINYNELVLKENKGDDYITDTMSKLNLFDENSFFSARTGVLHPSIPMPMNLKHNEEISSNQLNSRTTPNLPDLINGIDGYQNTTNEWEEALKNVMNKTNKQMEEKMLQNLQQQQVQNKSHIRHHEDLQRLQEVQKHHNILSSLGASQLGGAQTEFSTSSQSYLSVSDLSQQSNYLEYQQKSKESLNDNGMQNCLFGTNMSKFFDFHKHQQQKLQHCLNISCQKNINGAMNEKLHMMSITENNSLNSQLMDQSCVSTSQQIYKNPKGFAKTDRVPCQPTLQQVSKQQITPVKTLQKQYVQSTSCDDDLGFDPFKETQKALAELIENEEEHTVARTSTKLLNHKVVNNIYQPYQQNMIEYMQRSRMPPPGFNNFSGYGVVPRIQNSKVMSLMNLSNNYSAPTGQQIQHPKQLQIPSNAWDTHLGNYQQHINEQQIRQIPSGTNLKGYTGNDWTAMDPAILSFRQFSFPQQTPQIQPQQQEMFLQQLAQQQQQPGFTSQSQHVSGGNVGMSNTIMNSQQSSQTHVSANVQGMLEYLKTRQFV